MQMGLGLDLTRQVVGGFRASASFSVADDFSTGVVGTITTSGAEGAVSLVGGAVTDQAGTNSGLFSITTGLEVTFNPQALGTGLTTPGETATTTYALQLSDTVTTIDVTVRVTLTKFAAPVNTVAPVISGSFSETETLTVSDGTWTGHPTPAFTYQWTRDTVNISGATASAYTLVSADVDTVVGVKVTGTNSEGSATATVTGSTVAGIPTAPDQVAGLSVSPSNTENVLSWTAPDANGSAITDYVIEVDSGSGFTTVSDGTGTGTTFTHTGLTNGTEYDYRVSAVNGIGTGAASAVVSGTPTAESPPTLPTITSWQDMFDDNASNLAVWSTTNISLDDDIQLEGDSLTNGDFGGSVVVGEEWAAQVSNYISSTVNKTAVSGNTSAQIETRMLASGASVLDNYTLFNAGTNDTGLAASVTTANIDDIAGALTPGKFGIWVPLLATARTSGSVGLRDVQICNHIYDTYWPFVLDMQNLHAAAVGDSADSTDQAQAATGDIIDSLSGDGLHQNAAGHDAHTEPAVRLLAAMNDKAPYVPYHPPIAFDPTASSGASLYTIQKVGTADGFDIVGGNAGSEFAVSDAGVVSRGAGSWTDSDGIRELFVSAWIDGGDDNPYHTTRLPMVARGSLGDAVRWGRCSMVAEDVLGAAVSQFTVLVRADYATPGASRKNVLDFDDGTASSLGSSIRSIGFRNTSGQSVAVNNFGTWSGMNTIMLSYDSSANAGAGAVFRSDFVNGVHGTSIVFNGGGDLDLSGRLDLGPPFGVTYDDLDIQALAMWPGVWDLSSSTERDKFYNSGTGEIALATDGVVDGVAPVIFLAGGPGDWLAEFSTGTMQVNNRGSFSGSSIYQMPFADVSLAGIKGV